MRQLARTVTHVAGLRRPVQFLVAADLALFGCYSLIEARYRSIHKPPTEHIKRKVAETVVT